MVLSDVMLFGLVDRYNNFGESYCLCCRGSLPLYVQSAVPYLYVSAKCHGITFHITVITVLYLSECKMTPPPVAS
jgi:hypothetical protein